MSTFVTDQQGENPVMKAMNGKYKVITVKKTYQPKKSNVQVANIKVVFLTDILVVVNDLVFTALLMTKRIDEVVLIQNVEDAEAVLKVNPRLIVLPLNANCIVTMNNGSISSKPLRDHHY